MHRRSDRNPRHRTRLNLFDGWQVLGTIGLLLGMLMFSVLIAQSRHVLPSTGSAIRLIQTLVADTPRPAPSAEPAVAATPSPSPSAGSGAQLAVIQQAPAPRVWRPPVRGAAPGSQPPAPTPSAAPVPTPIPISLPSPTARPCIQKFCP